MKTAEEYQSHELAGAYNDAEQVAVIKAIQLEAYRAGMTEAAKILLMKSPDRSYDAESYPPTAWGDKRIAEFHTKIITARDNKTL